jgi:hypothetical protein
MLPSEIQLGHIYLVWRARKRVPVFIRARNVHGGFDGTLWPQGKRVRIKKAWTISEEYRSAVLPKVDFKSRAAGERDEE